MMCFAHGDYTEKNSALALCPLRLCGESYCIPYIHSITAQDLCEVAVPDNSCAYAGFIHRFTPFNFDSLCRVGIEDAFGSLFA